MLAAFFGCCVLATGGSGQQLFIEESDALAKRVDEIYVGGLRYLANTQESDGTWDDSRYGGLPGVVGLAVVSMLAHGEDPNYGPYSEEIHRSLDFILESQNEQTGYIGNSMYNHGFATLALAEAYGAVDDPRLGPALKRAVRLILSAQERNPLNAWRYSPESTDADTTVSGAQMVALFAARNAGVPVPQEAIENGLQFFLKCQTAEGGFCYTPGSSANPARTAIGCLSLALANRKDTDAYKEAFQYLKQAGEQSSYHYYYLYYASQAYFHASPEAWEAWNRKNIKKLAADQNQDGSWEGRYGTTFTTAASLLSLALNYRLLPIYERKGGD